MRLPQGLFAPRAGSRFRVFFFGFLVWGFVFFLWFLWDLFLSFLLLFVWFFFFCVVCGPFYFCFGTFYLSPLFVACCFV